MAVPVGFCEAEATFTCLGGNTMLQLFIGDTPLTNSFDILVSDMTAADVQVRIIPIAGVTVTVLPDSVFPLTCEFGEPDGFLHLLVRVASTTIITGSLNLGDSAPLFGNVSFSQFTCNLSPTKRKKNRVAPLRCPDEIIFKADIFHPQVKYCRNNIYNFYGTDEQGLLHYINSGSNISQRNTRNWWNLNI